MVEFSVRDFDDFANNDITLVQNTQPCVPWWNVAKLFISTDKCVPALLMALPRIPFGYPGFVDYRLSLSIRSSKFDTI